MLAAFVAYWLLHFGLYVAVFRQRAAFRRERTIFLYHALPAVIVATTVALWTAFAPSEEHLALAAAIIGLHGIYSLSFLELWSLAEGGYSLGILVNLEAARHSGRAPAWDSFAHVGSTKKTARVAGLQQLSLVETEAGVLHLTGRGRAVSSVLLGIGRLIALQRKG